MQRHGALNPLFAKHVSAAGRLARGLGLAVTLSAALSAAAAPDVPEGALEGEIVEVDGALYEVRDGELVAFDDGMDDPGLGAGDKNTSDKPGENDADKDAASAADAPAAPKIQQIEVTASRVDRGERSSVGTEVIDKDAIAESGARNLADLLERTPGMTVTSGLGTGQEVSIDGLDPKHVLILIDGKPVNGRVNDRVDVSRLPISPSDVERVEVVRGPMSALYGSEALGGVVNIITKRPTHGVSGSVETGTRISRVGAVRSGFSGSGSFNVGDLLLKGNGSLSLDRATDRAGRNNDTGLVTYVPDGVLDTPHRRQVTVGGEAGYFLGDLYLRSYANGSVNDVETRVSSAVPFRDHGFDAQARAGIGADINLPLQLKATSDLRVDRYFHRFEKLPDGGVRTTPPFCEDKSADGLRFFDPSCEAPPNVRSSATQDEVRLDAVVSQDASTTLVGFALPGWAGELGWAAGTAQQFLLAERLNGDGEDTYPGGGVLYVGALFAEVLWRPLPWLSVVPGLRADLLLGDVVDFNVGPKLSTRVELPWDLALRASYGHAYRPPSFQERLLRFDHSDLGYIVEGNPDLVPEKSDGARAELLWAMSDNVELAGELFGNVVTDLIVERPVRADEFGVPIYVYENVSRAWTSGLNLRLTTARLASFSFSLGYQYLFGAMDTSGCPDDNPYFCSEEQGAQKLLLRPTHSGNLAIRYRLAATDTDFFTRVDFMDERDIGNLTRAPGFVRIGAGLTQPVLDHLSFTFTLDNLLDSYDPVWGPKPGRHATIAVRGTL